MRLVLFSCDWWGKLSIDWLNFTAMKLSSKLSLLHWKVFYLFCGNFKKQNAPQSLANLSWIQNNNRTKELLSVCSVTFWPQGQGLQTLIFFLKSRFRHLRTREKWVSISLWVAAQIPDRACCFITKKKITLRPWWWSSGQHPCLFLWRSQFNSCKLLKISARKDKINEKEVWAGPSFINKKPT